MYCLLRYLFLLKGDLYLDCDPAHNEQHGSGGVFFNECLDPADDRSRSVDFYAVKKTATSGNSMTDEVGADFENWVDIYLTREAWEGGNLAVGDELNISYGADYWLRGGFWQQLDAAQLIDLRNKYPKCNKEIPVAEDSLKRKKR